MDTTPAAPQVVPVQPAAFSVIRITELMRNRRTLLLVAIIALCAFGMYSLYRNYLVQKKEMAELREHFENTRAQLDEAKRIIMGFMGESDQVDMEEMFESDREEPEDKTSEKKPRSSGGEMTFIVPLPKDMMGSMTERAKIEEINEEETKTGDVLESILTDKEKGNPKKKRGEKLTKKDGETNV